MERVLNFFWFKVYVLYVRKLKLIFFDIRFFYFWVLKLDIVGKFVLRGVCFISLRYLDGRRIFFRIQRQWGRRRRRNCRQSCVKCYVCVIAFYLVVFRGQCQYFFYFVNQKFEFGEVEVVYLRLYSQLMGNQFLDRILLNFRV